MTNENAKRKAMQELGVELDSMRVTDEQSFLEWIPLSARLAALGDHSHLKKWTALVSSSDVDLGACLQKRAHEGIWELDQTEGVDLALAIVAAQDFSCFLDLERDILTPPICDILTAWRERASEEYGDFACVEFLGLWQDQYPIAEENQLPPIAAPLSEFESGLIGLDLQAIGVQQLEWSSEKSRISREFIALSDTSPSDQLIASYELKQAWPTDDAGELTIFRTLTSNWRVRFKIKCEGAAVRSLRLGIIPGVSIQEGEFAVDLTVLPSNERRTLMGLELSLLLSNGRRILVGSLE